MNSILKKLLYCISIGTSFLCPAQNLVPNPSFEEYQNCSDLPQPWLGPTNNSVVYFNVCSADFGVPYSGNNYQEAKTGDAHIGIFVVNGLGLNYREYIQVELKNMMMLNNCYLVTYYVNYIYYSKYAINTIDASFSTTQINSTGTGFVLDLPSHVSNFSKEFLKDTMNWIKIEGVYVSSGEEKFITIGNFKNDANSSYELVEENGYPGTLYLIDDVSVIPIDSLNGMPAYAGADTLIAPGDSVFIGQEISNLNCTWRSLDGTVLATNTSGLYVQPTETTTYVVEQNLCGAISYDTVKVYVGYLGLNQPAEALEVGIMPNPNAGSFTIRLAKPMTATKTLFIYDNSGKLVKTLSLSFENSPEKKLDTDLENGVYFFKLKDENTDEQHIKKITVLH